MLTRDTSDGGTEFAWQFASKYPSNVYLCLHFFAYNVCGFGKVQRFFITVFLVRCLQRVGKIFLEGQKDVTSLFVIFEGWNLEKNAVFFRKRVDNVYLLTSSASLKTGSSTVLTMRNSSIKESNSASAMSSGHRGLVLSSSPFYLTLSALLNKGRNI